MSVIDKFLDIMRLNDEDYDYEFDNDEYEYDEDEEPEKDAPDAKEIESVKGHIRLENLSYSYNEEKEVLKCKKYVKTDKHR